MKLSSRARALAPVAALLLAACGSGTGSGTVAGGAPAASAPASTAEAAPAAPDLDDLNGDGTPDPACGQQDFGAGLVLRIPCEISNPNDPDEGVRLVKDSLFRLPALDADLTGISGSLVTARDQAGKRAVIIVFNSDNLFATGSDQLSESHTLAPVVTLINAKFPGAAIQVRGHTDKTGTTAANQALSQRRANTVQSYLTANGVKASAVTAVGLGSNQPLAEETNTDGSPSLPGRAFNRRVEVALRLP